MNLEVRRSSNDYSFIIISKYCYYQFMYCIVSIDKGRGVVDKALSYYAVVVAFDPRRWL